MHGDRPGPPRSARTLARSRGRLVAERRVQHESLRDAHRLGAGREQLLEDAAHGRVRVGVDLVDEPDAQRRLGLEALTRQEVAARRPGPILASTNGEMTAGTMPSFVSGKAKTASSPAIATSQQATSPTAPPSAAP